jgi:hypothetical protein
MENKRPYVNYAAKQQAQAAKQTPKPEPIESVAANAPEAAPAAVPVTEKVEAPVAKPIERIEEADEVTVKFVNTAILNVRSTPDATINNIVEQIKMDTKVNVIREVGEFSQIGDNKYVMTKYLI